MQTEAPVQHVQLNEQTRSDPNAAHDLTRMAHQQRVMHGVGIGLGASLILFAMVVALKDAFKDLTLSSAAAEKPRAHAAAAGK
jgi:hypothetical protein